MRKIFINGFTILVDDEDFDSVFSYKWNIQKHGITHRAIRSNCWTFNGAWRSKNTSIHRFVLKAEKGQIIDHIDGDGLNNQRENLRLCTHKQNMQNFPKKKGTSIYKGVSWDKRSNKWTASICVDGKKKRIGRYSSEKEAALAYNCAASFAFREFARLNVLG